MNKRLSYLEQVTADGSADSFAWYALALEYKKEAREADAIATFERLRARDPDYLPMYLLAGTLLGEQGRQEEARTWLNHGADLARRRGDTKTLNELLSALDGLSG